MACPFVRENISNMYWDVQDGAQSFWTRNHWRTFAHTSVVVLGKFTSTFKGARPHFGGNTKRVRETKRQRARENSRMIGWYKRDSVRTACKNLMVILSYVYLFTPLAKNRVVSSPPTINQPRRLVIPTPCASKKTKFENLCWNHSTSCSPTSSHGAMHRYIYVGDRKQLFRRLVKDRCGKWWFRAEIVNVLHMNILSLHRCLLKGYTAGDGVWYRTRMVCACSLQLCQSQVAKTPLWMGRSLEKPSGCLSQGYLRLPAQ